PTVPTRRTRNTSKRRLRTPGNRLTCSSPKPWRGSETGTAIQVRRGPGSVLAEGAWMKSWLGLLPLLMLVGCTPVPPASKPEPTVELVTYPSGGDTVHGIVHHPGETRPLPALVVVHGDHGLTDWVKAQAARLAGKGYVVLAVDLYRGQVVTNLMDAHIMDRGLAEDQVRADLKAAVDYLVSRRDVRADALGIIGWDAGGGNALDAAIHDPRLHAAVVCYGRLTTDPALLVPLQASVLGIFAGQDEGISPQTMEQFRAAMRKAGKRIAGIHTYPDCGHGFMDPTHPGLSGPSVASAVADAWDKIDAFLAAELKGR